MKRLVCVIVAFLTLIAGIHASAAENYEAPAETAQVAEDEVLLKIDLISDTHIGVDGTEEILSSVMNRITREADDNTGLIVAGDVTNSGEKYQMNAFLKELQRFPKERTAFCFGNHDYGLWSSSESHRGTMIEGRNEYFGMDSKKDYYSTEINGYKVVVMGNEGNHVNSANISGAQLKFLEQELDEGSANGKPVFVLCHWPLRNTHGERLLWPIIPGGALSSSDTAKVKAILKKYDNVFYISGHLHMGLNGSLFQRLFNICCVEKNDGITCINAPCCGKGNRFGVTGKGTGMLLTVTKDKLIIEGKNYLTGEIYSKYSFDIALKNFTPEVPAEADTGADEGIDAGSVRDLNAADVEPAPQETGEAAVFNEEEYELAGNCGENEAA